jgi:hypothetical protein
LGKASGSANRLLSRTVTVFAATRPGLVAGHLLAARQTAHSPYPPNPDFTG